MSRIAAFYYMTRIALCAVAMGHMTPAAAQDAKKDARRQAIEVESDFHRGIATASERAQELERLRRALPSNIAVDALQWQRSLLGNPEKSFLGASHLSALVRNYKKGPFGVHDKRQMIKWIDALTGEVIKRGDGNMFLVLAAHYVKQTENHALQNPFAGFDVNLGKEFSDLGKILAQTLETMNLEQQEIFKDNFAAAIAAQLINNCTPATDQAPTQCTPNADFKRALMGYLLLTQYAGGNTVEEKAATALAVQLLQVKLGSYRLTPDHLAGFMTAQGMQLFQNAVSTYVPGNVSAFMPLLEMGLRAEPAAAESIRRVFLEQASKSSNIEMSFYLYNQVHAIARLQSAAPMVGSLAQQIINPELDPASKANWDSALAAKLTPQRIKRIYTDRYINALPQEIFYVAKSKLLQPGEAAEVAKIYPVLLTQTVKKPAFYYQLQVEFAADPLFNRARDTFEAKMAGKDRLNLFEHLARIYIADTLYLTTSWSIKQIDELIGRTKPVTHITSNDFRETIDRLASSVKGNQAKIDRLVNVIAQANLKGWMDFIDAPYLKGLLTRLGGVEGDTTDEQFQGILRAQVDLRRQIKAWEPTIELGPRR